MRSTVHLSAVPEAQRILAGGASHRFDHAANRASSPRTSRQRPISRRTPLPTAVTFRSAKMLRRLTARPSAGTEFRGREPLEIRQRIAKLIRNRWARRLAVADENWRTLPFQL